MKEPSLKVIISECRQNNRRYQEVLYRRYFDQYFGVCRKMVHNDDDALDILNQGFLKVFTKLDQYDGAGSFEGWMYRVIYFTALDFLRKQKAQHGDCSDSDEMFNTPYDAQIDQNLLLEDLMHTIYKLPKATRVVFELFAIEGHTHVEIAKNIGISVGTSKWHLNQARKFLRKALHHDYELYLQQLPQSKQKTA